MTQKQMEIPEFKLVPEVFLGTTPWLKTTEQTPPCTGWWKTRRSESPYYMQPQRRWWDGENWSMPVFLTDPDTWVENAKRSPAETTNIGGVIEWCGLKHPHPDTSREEMLRLAPELGEFLSFGERLASSLLAPRYNDPQGSEPYRPRKPHV